MPVMMGDGHLAAHVAVNWPWAILACQALPPRPPAGGDEPSNGPPRAPLRVRRARPRREDPPARNHASSTLTSRRRPSWRPAGLGPGAVAQGGGGLQAVGGFVLLRTMLRVRVLTPSVVRATTSTV
jgi:hypothetical protein